VNDRDVVDLRSDTVTRPTPAMREAMAHADVGDDVYGEDPTVQRLEARVAELVGKDAAVFVPSGTMANQIALLLHTRRGDDVVIGEGTHVATFESGAAAAWSGVQFTVAGKGGLFDANDVKGALKPNHMVYPRSSLVVVENTHNRAGGRTFPEADVRAIAVVARGAGLALHLDGARLWNAAIARGRSEAELAAPFDTVSVCFSKGLGAPVGSALVVPSARVAEARRFRKMLGGGMRQAGVLAAAALYAVEHHRERLVEDHRAAKDIAEIVGGARGASVEASSVETNIVNVDLTAPPERVVAEARRLGVWVSAIAPHRIRIVTHLDVSREQARSAGERLARAIETATRTATEAT